MKFLYLTGIVVGIMFVNYFDCTDFATINNLISIALFTVVNAIFLATEVILDKIKMINKKEEN